MPPVGTLPSSSAPSPVSTVRGGARTSPPGRAGADELAARILGLLLPHRRASDPELDATPGHFPLQLEQLVDFIAAGDPILFTLPGFPCKSPNPAKVLGHLPDEGERLSLTFLNGLCGEIGALYEPGARILICSDGHLFGDLIHVPDDHIDDYSDELAAMIEREGLTHLTTFDLRAVLGDLPFDEKRARVHDRYAPSVEELREQILTDEETLRLYRGITRFLTGDTVGFTGTRSALQRDCRRRAYGVMQRSRAWGNLIAEQHPRSFRLSIHPQRAGVLKFGIRLLEAADSWMTPWHSSVLHRADGRWELLRSEDAAKVGRLVERDGRPSHYEIV
ncbi:L-tyrosine/L-tryptophan isonitrile synthase family protein [Streptomyces kaniharaensis]|uniref:L-tyrosine/L-tryptophan isonitrile synthase family protein n=1 Tax=Streptomyces kaniharaensis TaxID=212423 RepID=A0A6N7KYG0_9ACTN|nr:isocyanide synthase family protein [Streptomyces kaniharaensis]MQS15004.1 L-tyrosine/L-tryptophan isonitrile synthase family protein [Streptomyces kaniharaensis]